MLTRHWQRLLLSISGASCSVHCDRATHLLTPFRLVVHDESATASRSQHPQILATNARWACGPRASFVPLPGSLLLLRFIFQLLRCMRNIPVVSLVVCVFFEARVVSRVFEDHD